MKARYCKKLGMTRVYSETGESIPVTVLSLDPNVVYQIKTKETDGYEAFQVGVGTQKPQRVNRPLTGHFAVAKAGMPEFVAELRLDKHGMGDLSEAALGEDVSFEGFLEPGAKVDVLAVSVGKGFAGVMKRHHMKGQKATHGTHEYFRHGGSIGNRKFPGRVFKNKRMPGHMGCEQVIQERLTVFGVRPEDKALLVKGSVPGSKGGYVLVRQSVRA